MFQECIKSPLIEMVKFSNILNFLLQLLEKNKRSICFINAQLNNRANNFRATIKVNIRANILTLQLFVSKKVKSNYKDRMLSVKCYHYFEN